MADQNQAGSAIWLTDVLLDTISSKLLKLRVGPAITGISDLGKWLTIFLMSNRYSIWSTICPSKVKCYVWHWCHVCLYIVLHSHCMRSVCYVWHWCHMCLYVVLHSHCMCSVCYVWHWCRVFVCSAAFSQYAQCVLVCGS